MSRGVSLVDTCDSVNIQERALKIFWPGNTYSEALTEERKDLEPYQSSCTDLREVYP